jgi:hypothetical protein
MGNSSTLEVAIGLVFCYASIALATSALYEGGASLFKLRASSLLDGIKAMLKDEKFVGLARELYGHPLINPRAAGQVDEKDLDLKPSYIDPQSFAVALVEVIQKAAGADLASAIANVRNEDLRAMLQGMYDRGGGKLEVMHQALAKWFDSAMDRVSGGYKRQAQLVTFLIGLALSVLLNADSLTLFHRLWLHPVLVAQVSVPAGASEALEQMKVLPLGWIEGSWTRFLDAWYLVSAGWLITALTTLFGAPFWFDLLARLVRLRGTGPRPQNA